MADLTFYYCTNCGAMYMKNFRDTYCSACNHAMAVKQVNVFFDQPCHIEEVSAPHTDD